MGHTDGKPIVRASATEEFLSRGRTGTRREREIKDDGRYIIFYTFEDDENPGEAEKSEGD